MISTWSEWKRYPRPGRGENIEAPITPGLYEVRYAGTGALHSFEAVDNVAQALAQLSVGSKSWFGRRDSAKLPDLEYRTCATSSRGNERPLRVRPLRENGRPLRGQERDNHDRPGSIDSEATAGIEPAMKVLQTSALPLGYVALGARSGKLACRGGRRRAT